MSLLKQILSCCSLIVITSQVWGQAPHTSIMAMASDGKDLRTVIKLDEYPSVGSPDVSPDGSKIAFDGWHEGGGSSDAQIFIIDLAKSEIQHLGPGAMPTWSADGKYLAYSGYSPRGVFIRSADGVAKKQIDPEGWGIQWSPDGQKLSYTVRSEIVVYDILTDEKKRIQPKPEEPYNFIYYNADWSPDSRKLCFKAARPDGDYETAILDVTQEDPKATICFQMKKGWGNEYAWHPNNETITIVKWGKPARLYEFKPEADVTPTEIPGQPEGRPSVGSCWSPDGKILYFLSRDN